MSWLHVALEVIEVVSLAIDVADKLINVLNKAGVLENTNNSDELGAKVMQAREINITPPEERAAYEQYIKQIDAMEIDPDKNYSAEDKQAAANEFLSGALNVVYADDNGVTPFLQEVNAHSSFYEPDQIKAYLDKSAESQLDMGDIGKYFDDKLDSMQDILRTEDVLIDAEKSLGLNDDEIKQKFDDERVHRNQDLD